MRSLDDLGNSLLSLNPEGYPPVHSWNPPLSGNIDITIKANGDWLHEGVRFTRQRLVKLFSSILKKEGDDYFLVTPVEKWQVTVEDAPLLIVDMEVIPQLSSHQPQVINFRTTTDDVFPLGRHHPLRILSLKRDAERRPYVLARYNLDALVHRNVFYRLAELSVAHEKGYGVWSSGEFFALE